ncbi:hypothetical protein B0J18DRAFT_144583 [Chaetomium sp. MPI-SDFR-AT-0129]|nr:hypothetical protein B0J18DRAFT_144583 [Chaetomium sp. MPI-SDFR-AT-0129]
MGPPSYRQIQPAPIRAQRSGAPSNSSGPGGGRLSAKGLTKRLKAVTQACHTCRRNKAKCDGVRPRCGGCTTRGSACGYDGEAGQSRQAALRARLEELEKLVGDLRSMPDAEAERLLQRLRASANDSVLGTASESRSPAPTTIPASVASSESSFPSRSSAPSPASSGTSGATGATSVSDDGPIIAGSSPRSAQHPIADDLAELLHMDLPLPNAKTTWAGVESFFSSCGRLFHIYSPQQMEAYYKTVFGVDGKPDTSQKLAICCLHAVAAVGIQYNPNDFQKGLEKTFHEVSRRFFSEVMEERPLDTIKVCTLFALYNILDKATVALAYVEVGLSMSKRQSSSTGVCHPSMVSAEEWIDFRRTWRALLFFSSWLSSTLGYISGADDTEFAKLLPIAEQDHDSYSAEIGELVQAEMTKLTLLEAGILRNHLAVEELTTLGLDGVIRELQDWHGQLPDTMQLSSLFRYDWPPLVRWSIYYLHLLYHGAFMLVYRRIAAHCVRLQRTGVGLAAASKEPTMLSLVEQGITSARDTARIVSLLLEDQGVFRRCWIVIFQTHTACVVLLHSVAQRQAQGFPPSSWADDLKLARQCLDVLGFCGAVDPVALRFRVRLTGIYDSLLTSGHSPQLHRAHIEDWVPPHPDQTQDEVPAEPHPVSYMFALPPPSMANNALFQLSFSLLFALCKPWSDTSNLTSASAADLLLASTTAGNPKAAGTFPAITASPTSAASPSATEGLTIASSPTDTHSTAASVVAADSDRTRLLDNMDWDFGKATPFRWDTDGMGMLHDGEVVGESCFLDSEAPNGWTLAEDLDEVDVVE